MKFKSKISDILLLIGTIIAICISIVLWIFVMTNDQRFSRINQANDVTSQQSKNRNSKSLYDLYLPTNSYGYQNGKLYRLYDSQNNIPYEFSQELQHLKVKRITKYASGQASYTKMLANQNYVQLTYPDEITFNLFTNVTSKKDNRQFSRIFVTDNNHVLYLGNDRTNQLYRLTIEDANFKRVRRFAKNAHNKVAASFVRLKTGYTAFYNKSEKWKVYGYLTSRQSDSYFVSRLLGTSGVSTRTNKKGQTVYSLNYYTRLSVPKADENSHTYFYTHYEKSKIPSTTNRLLDSIYYVHRLGLMEQDLRFFDTDDASVKYTNYIEGMPVFLNKTDTQIDTNFSADAITVAFNSTNFQIPIPFDGQTITLGSTNQVVQRLAQHGLEENEIDRIIVGFKVEKDSTHTNLVNLIPTYYVKAYGQWKPANEWMKQDLSVYQAIKGGK